MKKFALLVMVALIQLTQASAQRPFVPYEKPLARQGIMSCAPMKKSLRKADLNYNQRLVGYYVTDDYDNALGLAAYPGEQLAGAMLERADFSNYIGAKVVGMRYALGSDASATAVLVYAGNSMRQLDLKASSEQVTSNQGWNTVMFPADKCFEIADSINAMLIAYGFTQTTDNYPICVYSKGPARNLYVYANVPVSDGGNGEGWYNMGSKYGAVSIQLIVESDKFPKDAVTPQDFGSFYTSVEGEVIVPVTFLNNGAKLESIDYMVSIDGVDGMEQHLSIDHPLGAGGAITMGIPFKGAQSVGTQNVQLKVTKVNGQQNESQDNSASGTMVTLSKALPKSVVVETYTGTGEGFAPRGIAGMEHLRAMYENQCLAINIHQATTNDIMQCEDYADLGFTEVPSSIINRSGKIVDSYYGEMYSGIDVDFGYALSGLPLVGVDVTGEWSQDSTFITATANVEALSDGDYDICFVLTADSLTGTTSRWRQHNYYYQFDKDEVGASNDSLLAQFCKGGEYGQEAFQWTFNDVLIGSSYQQSVNQATLGHINEGDIVSKSYQLDMPKARQLLKAIKKEKVSVTAIVMDKSGKVVNAARHHMTAYDPTGICSAPEDSPACVKAIYNCAGQRVAESQHGLVIVQYSDGRVKKIMR